MPFAPYVDSIHLHHEVKASFTYVLCQELLLLVSVSRRLVHENSTVLNSPRPRRAHRLLLPERLKCLLVPLQDASGTKPYCIEHLGRPSVYRREEKGARISFGHGKSTRSLRRSADIA